VLTGTEQPVSPVWLDTRRPLSPLDNEGDDSMKTLIVDDEHLMLELLTHQLNAIGDFDITTSTRGEDAVRAVEAADIAIELILCDLQMPEMDGVEFIRHLLRVGYEGALILVSGEDARILHAAESLARASDLDVRGSLQKPVSIAALREVLFRKSHPHPRPGPRASRKTYSAEELQSAISEARLINHYQPKIDLLTGVCCGVEALVRWNHPQDGLILPDQFIGTAEENGLIDSLTRAVASSAFLDLRRWMDDGFALHLAINVSMENLSSLDFPEFISAQARIADVPLDAIVLEVTESRLMKNPRAALDILARLRLRHVGLSIDDFGTGHSSLVQLRDIPFSEMKIDRSFVHGAASDEMLRAITESSLKMARQLKLQTVGEGVENEDDWNFLVASGCDLAQGYFIAKPMPAEAVSEWIYSWRPDI
jgi:EAL domain-containing protein (putative c-di-GMP-specific phosphodiesterase class I)/ActR/RegA family two-component response regulator